MWGERTWGAKQNEAGLDGGRVRGPPGPTEGARGATPAVAERTWSREMMLTNLPNPTDQNRPGQRRGCSRPGSPVGRRIQAPCGLWVFNRRCLESVCSGWEFSTGNKQMRGACDRVSPDVTEQGPREGSGEGWRAVEDCSARKRQESLEKGLFSSL